MIYWPFSYLERGLIVVINKHFRAALFGFTVIKKLWMHPDHWYSSSTVRRVVVGRRRYQWLRFVECETDLGPLGWLQFKFRDKYGAELERPYISIG